MATKQKIKKLIPKKACPNCGKKRLIRGPFYDIGRIVCLQCGHVFKVKVDR